MTKVFTLRDSILVEAPIERCFQLSTCIAIVESELKMRPMDGPADGFVTDGDTVLWRGWKFGLPQLHESLIEAFDPPRFFRDRMLRGRFHTFEHDHYFLDQKDGTVMLADELRFSMPFGRLGELVGKLLLVPHIRGLMHRRFARLKRTAESEDWRQYLEGAGSSLRPE
ncbi:SRPBCC family protein [Silvibacterium acidisoli]|uniref:SRPBCC family protein n=1 Tax=Acidobacteriaceae bacterium ZG23-2 TaxID=2883246 RepID=UPI00406BE374